MKWGFNKSLNEKVDLQRTREQEAFTLLKYTLKEVSKIWVPEVSAYLKGYPAVADRVFSHLDDIDRVFMLYLENKANKKQFKVELEKLYQSVLKVNNLSKVSNNKQIEAKI